MDASFVLPARPLLKTVCPLLSIPHAKNDLRTALAVQLSGPGAQLMSIDCECEYHARLCFMCWNHTVRLRGDQVQGWYDKPQWSCTIALIPYRVTYQTWRTPWTEKPSKLWPIGLQEADTI